MIRRGKGGEKGRKRGEGEGQRKGELEGPDRAGQMRRVGAEQAGMGVR